MYQKQVETILEGLDAIGVTPELVDKRHGGPYDRGGADAWYQRGCEPHYYQGASMSSLRIPEDCMTDEQVLQYELGYYEVMASGDHKDWG